MPIIIQKYKWPTLLIYSLALLALFVVACGGATGSSSTGEVPLAAPAQNLKASGPSSGQHTASSNGQQQYLIKTLSVNMEVKDTQRAANDLQAWISVTDPLSTAQTINYQQVGDNLYTVSMTFSVQASLFPRIENYLNNYPLAHKGRLLSTNMGAQDVSNDYIDTQSRLTNLRGERDRLLTLMSHASALGDILSIDQRLTDVEGQIEQMEAHLNSLTGQTSFYTISISLQPSSVAVTPPPASWSAGAIWQNALSAAIAFAQALATVVIWLAAFSVYLIPLALIAWFARRWRLMKMQRAAPKTASPTSPSQI